MMDLAGPAASDRRYRNRPMTPWEQRRYDRLMRDIEIMRLARDGWQDKDIGRRVGLHAKSVNRIINNVRRALRAFEPERFFTQY